MTGALATCDRCGHIEITDSSTIVVRRCVDTGHVDYRFVCPVCSRVIVRPLDCRMVHLLITAGATVEQWKLPAELNERPGPDAPAITLDDLIDLHNALEQLPTARARARGAQ